MSLARFLHGRQLVVTVMLFLAPAVAGAADVDQRTMVLAGYRDELFEHPDVLLEWYSFPDMTDDIFLADAGAVSVGLRGVGTPDDLVVAEVMVARGFIVTHTPVNYDRAHALLTKALAEAGRLGWSDGKANGILRDLAWLATARGDSSEGLLLGERAATCPEPCAEDHVAVFGRSLKTIQAGVIDVLGLDGYNGQVLGLHYQNSVTFARETFGPRSTELSNALYSRAVYAEDNRPWDAIAYYQDVIDFHRAGGAANSAAVSARGKIAELMLEVGEYARLAPFAAELGALRLRARALWHLRDPAARAAYREAIASSSVADSDLLQDLVDARYDEETVQVADAWLLMHPGAVEPSFAKARVAARAGRFQEAADLVAAIAEPNEIAKLQLAFFLEKAGKVGEAEAIRRAIPLPQRGKWNPWGGWTDIQYFAYPRDCGAYEGAAAYATTYLTLAEGLIGSDYYAHAQHLWQIAYTLALGGDTQNSFRLMGAAASIAARVSFSSANATDGGSLQLLRRDKFRYLLFVDIAWAATTGTPPDSMSVSSRY